MSTAEPTRSRPTVQQYSGAGGPEAYGYPSENAKFVISGLNTWGWILIFTGIGQGLVALGVWAQVRGVRWIGVAIYGQIAHGKRAEA